MPTWAKVIGGTVLALTALGAVFGIFGGGFPRIWKMGHAGDWSWWHYALAVPLLGVAYLVGDGIGQLIISPFTWVGADHPMWKRVISFTLILILGVALLLGPWWLLSLSR